MLDESAPKRLAQAVRSRGYDVFASPEARKGAGNGQLLARIESSIPGCLLTCDKSLRFQQTIGRRRLALVVLPKQRFEDLQPFPDEIGRVLRQVRLGEAAMVNAPSNRQS